MKKFTLLMAGVAMASTGLAAEAPPADNPSAYAAMRLVGRQLGGDSLSRIVEISGRDGVPQPFIWKVVVKEKSGVREVEVAGGKLANERMVEASPSGGLPPIRLQDLNLDSSGAFEAADTQARKVRLRFDSLGYLLRVGEGGKPVWTLDLMDRDGARVGGMRLAASDGAAISVEGRLASNPTPEVSRPVRPAGDVPPAVLDEEENAGGFFTRTGRTLDRANETVKRNLRKASSRVQRFFGLHPDETPPAAAERD